LNGIYRPKFYRYWSKNKGFTHVIAGILTEKFFLTLNLTGLCPETLFECPEHFFSTSLPPLGKIVAKKKIAAGHHLLLQGNSNRHPPN
jgi:hypothetical protein